MAAKVSNRPSPGRGEAARVLKEIFSRYNRRFLKEDPVWYVHQYGDPRDQEVVALICALLAFGNVKAIHGSLERLLTRLGPRPAERIRQGVDGEGEAFFEGLGHRWVRGADLQRLLGRLGCLLAEEGSLKAFFLRHYRSEDANIGPLLARVAQAFYEEGGKGPTRGYAYFFPSPTDGSPCKRLSLFLRWMVRPPDGIDLGLWSEIPPSRLVIPLDIHVYRFSRRFRLSPYKTPRWEVSLQVTDFLKELDRSDPVKYDFAICHYGMEVGW